MGYVLGPAVEAIAYDGAEGRTPVVLALKLCEEAGEVAREIKKIELKGKDDRRDKLIVELGDVFSAMIKLAGLYDISFTDILDRAIEKRGLA